jgi:type IV secretory pathway VirJ component
MNRIIIGIALFAFFWSGAQATEDSFQFGRFGTVHTYYQSPQPKNIVLFVSGDGGWNLGVVDMARSLSSLDALVVGIDIIHYLKQLESSGDACSFPASDFELLSKYVQKKYGYDNYAPPILVGYSSGATLIYAILVQAPSTTFRGGISMGFCPDLPLIKPFCRGNNLAWTTGPKGKGYSFLPSDNLEVPWVVLQGDIDQVCSSKDTAIFAKAVKNAQIYQLPKVGHGFSVPKNWMPQFKEAYLTVAAAKTTEPPSEPAIEVGDLPLEVIPSNDSTNKVLVVHITGDGGWGITDRGLAKSLSDSGISVVGLNSLHYFWKEKDPDRASKDLERILRYYMSAWNKNEIILSGYSLGADVLPFMANRLPEDLISKVKLIVLIGPSAQTEFKFHLSDWIGGGPGKDALPVRPEIDKLKSHRITCFYGQNDNDDICEQLDTSFVKIIQLQGGHLVRTHFDPIAMEIINAAKPDPK